MEIKFFNSKSLSSKFFLSLGLMLVPILAIGISAVLSLHRQHLILEDVVGEILNEKEPVTLLQDKINGAMIMLYRSGVEDGEAARREFEKSGLEINGIFSRIGYKPFAHEKERKSIQTVIVQWRLFEKLAADLFDSAGNLDSPELADRYQKLETVCHTILGELQLIQDMANREINQAEEEVNRVERTAILTMLVTLAAGLAIVVRVGMLLGRSVLQPMGRLGEGAEQLASGHLHYRLPIDRQDEFGALMGTFNQMAAALQEGQHALKNMAISDSLTALNNHREFFRLLQEEVDRSCRYEHAVSLLMIDLDKFKDINDKKGHLAGDQVLRQVAKIIRQQIRKSDHAGRYGGDEFAVVLPETDQAEAFDFAERLQKTVAAGPVLLETGEELPIALSIGVASFPEDASTSMQLVAASDQALYRAKEDPLQRVCCPRPSKGAG
jgi:diguanylate cyclase (GGDEF)-like protein